MLKPENIYIYLGILLPHDSDQDNLLEGEWMALYLLT